MISSCNIRKAFSSSPYIRGMFTSNIPLISSARLVVASQPSNVGQLQL